MPIPPNTPSVAALVRTLIRQALDDGRRLPASEVAAEITVSPGHLRRVLRAESTTVLAIRDVVYLDEAATGLRRGESVEAVSRRLGFAEPSSFRRAFKRWTGLSPSRFLAEGAE